MSELLDLALQAHGDLKRWSEVQRLGEYVGQLAEADLSLGR